MFRSLGTIFPFILGTYKVLGNIFKKRVPKSEIVPKVVPKTGSAVPSYPNMDKKIERRTMHWWPIITKLASNITKLTI
jgi:hypothetical protein